MHIHNKLKR